MRKNTLVLAGLGLLTAVATASAGSVNLYFKSGCGDAPGVSNATLYIGDATQDTNLSGLPVFNGTVNYHTGSLQLMMDVGSNGGGACGVNTISSLGLDINLATVSGTATLVANDLVINTNAALAGTGTEDPWSAPSPNNETLNVAGKLVQDSRAVAVPSAHFGSAGGELWGGYCPGTGYNVGTLTVHSSGTALSPSNPTTTFALRMAVGNLKITRIYDPLATQGNANETVNFGAGDASPDNGSVVGVQNNTVADATVIARKKGDFGSFDGNGVFSPTPDGVVGAGELAQFLAAVGQNCSTDPVQTWAGDFGRFDGNGIFTPNPDGVVGAGELAQFLAAVGS